MQNDIQLKEYLLWRYRNDSFIADKKNIGRKVMDRKDNKMKILRVIATLLVVIGHSNFYLISTNIRG